jgi:hypothetical protein
MISMPIRKTHNSFFHRIIFRPSKGPNGSRLKKARNTLIYAMKKEIDDRIPSEKYQSATNNRPKHKFVNGPATEIFPISSLFGLPNI